jgi:hypothetical protein
MPKTDTRFVALGKAETRWNGTFPVPLVANQLLGECRGWDRAAAEAEMDVTWRGLKASLDSLCVGELSAGWQQLREDGLHSSIAEAASVVGWADSRLVAAELQLNGIKSAFKLATTP